MEAIAPEPGPRSQSILRAARWTTGAQALAQIPWFGSLIVLASLVPPEDYGAVSFGLAIVGFASVLVGAGVRGELQVRSHLDARGVAEARRRAILSGTALAILMALIMPLVIQRIAPGVDAVVLQALALSVVLLSVAVVPQAVLQRHLLARRTAAVLTSSALFGGTLGVAAGLAGAGVWALVLRQVGMALILAAGALWATRGVVSGAATRAASGTAEDQRDLTRRWFTGLAFAAFVIFNADTYYLGALRGADELGPYALAFTLAFAPVTQVAWQVGKVLLPSAAAAQDPATNRQRLTSTVTAISLMTILAPAAWVVSPPLVQALLGPEWSSMVLPFRVLLLAALLHAVVNTIGEFLSGTGEVRLHARAHLLLALVLVVTLPPAIVLGGAAGAAFAHLVCALGLLSFYATRGLATFELGPGDVVRAAQRVLEALALQVAVSAALTVVLVDSSGLLAAGATGLCGLAAAASWLMLRPPPVLNRLRSRQT